MKLVQYEEWNEVVDGTYLSIWIVSIIHLVQNIVEDFKAV